ncbi:MAG: ATP-binding cassette domain-containing protein [Clostridiales bacterium]|nr:ATP-binding cassette domain-containing protein [Clostridiales bacterium]
MSYIQIEHLNFTYPDAVEPVFSDFSLHLDSDWKLGLTGRNGRGKTTLLRLLSGQLKGEGRITCNLPLRQFPCDIPDPEKCAYEIAESIAPEAELWRIQREMALLNLPEETLYRPFSTLSGGERTKFLLAALFACEGYPLLDEPTDHLDGAGRACIAKYLSGKRGFLVVSHDRAFLDSCCDHILSLSRSGAELVRGNYSVWREERDKAERADRAAKEKLESERTRLAAATKRTADWANRAEKEKFHLDKDAGIDRGYLGAKAAKLQKRANATKERRAKAEAEIKELLKKEETDEELKLCAAPFYKSELLRLNGITVKFGERTLFSDLSFAVNAGERVVLSGGNGTGKSTLFQIVTGGFSEYTGELYVPKRLKISYVPQIYEYRGTLQSYAAEKEIDEGYFKAILAKLGFDPRDFTRDMRLFSDGQKKKAALARSLCEKANLYIWDEPLNYLDVIAREQLERAVLASNATILFAEHDSSFVEHIATRRIVLG